MPSQFKTAQDRLNAAALGRFGIPASAPDAATIDGVPVSSDFIAATKEHDVDGMGMTSREPTLTVLDADVPAAPVGRTVVAQGGTYTVIDLRADGLGLTQLVLQKGK